MKLTDKRLEKLDTAIRFYSCMRKTEDEVIIKMSKDLFSELIASSPFVMLTTDELNPYQYKGHDVMFVSDDDYVAVAYFNTRTGKEHHIREIKEEQS